MLDELNRLTYNRTDTDSRARCAVLWIVVLLTTGGVILASIFFVIMAAGDSSVHNISSRPSASSPENPSSKLQQGRYLGMTQHAIRLSNDMYYLGIRDHPRHGQIKGFVSIRYDTEIQSNSLPPISTASPINGTTSPIMDTCSTVLAAGARWRKTVNYIIDSTNSQRLSEAFVVDMVTYGMNQWNRLLTDFHVFGVRDTQHTAEDADFNNPDGLNIILFAHMNSDSIIAATITWGIFDGPISERELVEADVILNDDFIWGDAGVQGASVMDGKNEITHEFGHFVGMGHSKNRVECQDDTMLATSQYGETKKRTLSVYDQMGYCDLYNNHVCALNSPPSGNTTDLPPMVKKASGTIIHFNLTLILFTLVITTITMW